MKVDISSKKSVEVYQITRRHVKEDSNINMSFFI